MPSAGNWFRAREFRNYGVLRATGVLLVWRNALIWQQNRSLEDLAIGGNLYAENCAACHGETGKGDGIMVRNLSTWSPNELGQEGMSSELMRPPDFTELVHLLGASPALLEGKIIRGGMGTGMPYWGPIFTSEQISQLIGYLYTFVW